MAGIVGLVILVIGGTALLPLGGGGEEAQELSGEELVERADELCRRGQQRFAQIQAEPPANAGEAARQAEELIGVSEDEVRDLRELEPAAEQRARFERYLDAREEAIESLREGRAAAQSRDARGYAAAQARSTATRSKRARLARALGFGVCSQPAPRAPVMGNLGEKRKGIPLR